MTKKLRGPQQKLGVKKDHKQWSGSIPKVAKLIGVHPETIRRWFREKQYHVFKNGYEITFDYKEIRE